MLSIDLLPNPEMQLGNPALALVVMLFAEPAIGEAGAFSPARFKDGAGSLVDAIDFPGDAAEVDETLNCEASISRTGRFLDNHCFVDEGRATEYLNSIANAVKDLRLEPAVVDGDRKRVLFQYSVTFRRSAGHETVEVFPHHGGRRYSPGEPFSTPQRYGEHGRWPRFCYRDHPVLIQIHVAASGLSQSFDTLSPVSESCARSLKRYLDSSRYIPAMRGGAPVASIYQEVFWLTDQCSIKGPRGIVLCR